MKRRLTLAPEEGWLTLGLVLLLCLTLAWSVDGARYVLGRDEYLDFLVYAAAGGVLVGFIGPKVGWGRWLTFLIGSIFAALLVPMMVGLLVHPTGASLHTLFQSTSDASVQAYIDIAIRRLPVTTQFLHHALIIGLLIWATSMFASYAVFGHRRTLSAVVVVGVLLVANMSITFASQLAILVVFTLAALLLLIRAHVFEEQSEWLRRRIGDPASIATVYLRGGAGFIAITVAAALALTVMASSAPLAGAWGGVGDGLVSLSKAVSRFLPTGGMTHSLGIAFGSTSVVRTQWNNNDALAITIQRDPKDKTDYYWRAFAYDQIGLNDWSVGPKSTSIQVPANTSILDGLADDPVQPGRKEITFTVTPEGFHDATMISAATPTTANQGVRVSYVGADGYFTVLERDGGNGQYQLTASVAVRGNAPGELNDAALRATGRAYPPELLDLYTQVPDGALGPNATALEQKIEGIAGDEPIDFAEALQKELRSSTYQYKTDVSDVDCGSRSTTECFATFKQGFCQWYALTMTTIMRDEGIPARMVEGFLPGTRDPSGAERILNNNAHAWVEVYFPTYGWVTFDPTGANLPTQIGPLPSGNPVAASPSASGSVRPAATIRGRDLPPEDPGGVGAAGSTGGTPAGPLIAVTVLLLVIVAGIAFAVWRRGPRGGTTADAAYGMVTQIASRLGFGPRPQQTVYEYAGTLSDVLPDVRPELETVARAKVEAVYARQVLGDERIETLRAAQRRLRVALLRLAFRRKERRRRR